MMEEEAARWFMELRRRSHEQGNEISRIEGQITGLKMLADERHSTMVKANEEMRAHLLRLDQSVNQGFNDLNLLITTNATQVATRLHATAVDDASDRMKARVITAMLAAVGSTLMGLLGLLLFRFLTHG